MFKMGGLCEMRSEKARRKKSGEKKLTTRTNGKKIAVQWHDN